MLISSNDHTMELCHPLMLGNQNITANLSYHRVFGQSSPIRVQTHSCSSAVKSA